MNTFGFHRLLTLFPILLALSASAIAEPVGTAFSYQGEMKQAGEAANGQFDFEFSLFDVATDGEAIAPPLQLEGVNIQDGVFTVELDFGPAAFGNSQLWLSIGVRLAGAPSPYTLLSPRQKLTSNPYALEARVALLESQSRIPFQEYFKVSLAEGVMESDFIPLPVDEEWRLVITHIYVDGADNSSRTAFALYVNHTSPAVYDYLEWWNLPGDETPVGGLYYLHSIHQPALVYIEPGIPADFRIFRYKLGVESGTYHVGFSGYYETP